jgi:hypothetical protein
MIKRFTPAAATPEIPGQWRELGDQVEVELTSEDSEWPIEGALTPGQPRGWRAGAPGVQTVRLIWPEPIRLQRVRLVFEEQTQLRTQELVLRATTTDGEREIVRQQFTFAPPGTTVEREEYAVALDRVTGLILTIDPAIGRGDVVASLKEWRVA